MTDKQNSDNVKDNAALDLLNEVAKSPAADFVVPTLMTGNPAIGLAAWLGSLFRRKRNK